jgi:hypothetical protein
LDRREVSVPRLESLDGLGKFNPPDPEFSPTVSSVKRTEDWRPRDNLRNLSEASFTFEAEANGDDRGEPYTCEPEGIPADCWRLVARFRLLPLKKL